MQAKTAAEPGKPSEAIRTRVLTLVASIYDVPVGELLRVTRGSTRAVAARQVAIYLSHTVLAMTLADLSRAFGRRPSTTLHAVRRVEAMREDAKIDTTISWLESLLRDAMEAA
ncbi:MAG: chromosomal replication initiator DnaA [Alphaproteobacteria bacterium]|nr:chromosomal replication initiator DnaA [Alphaproteobacteria bacterium]MBL7097904.1 chromosomal replication initiator DnaA [Alphaproteobacteria bacterium]